MKDTRIWHKHAYPHGSRRVYTCRTRLETTLLLLWLYGIPTKRQEDSVDYTLDVRSGTYQV